MTRAMASISEDPGRLTMPLIQVASVKSQVPSWAAEAVLPSAGTTSATATPARLQTQADEAMMLAAMARAASAPIATSRPTMRPAMAYPPAVKYGAALSGRGA